MILLRYSRMNLREIVRANHLTYFSVQKAQARRITSNRVVVGDKSDSLEDIRYDRLQLTS